MKNAFLLTVSALAAAMLASSCAYDPYYSSAGGSYDSYNSGYGAGFGYGGRNFSTSYFVSTGDPRWGYDPYCYSYYDYRSRRYYDPYLYGYYPVGYRPPVVVGVPHPYGWRPGRGYCPPPSRVRDVTVVNYHNRVDAYRRSNYDWATQVRQRPVTESRPSVNGRPATGYRPGQQQQQQNFGKPRTEYRPGVGSGGNVRQQSPSRGPSTRTSESRDRQSQYAKPPAVYNTPVTRPAPQQAGRRETVQSRQIESRSAGTKRQGATNPSRGSSATRQPQAAPREYRQQSAPRQQEANPTRREEARPNRSGGRGMRSLGQG
jgi:hypothetical protein